MDDTKKPNQKNQTKKTKWAGTATACEARQLRAVVVVGKEVFVDSEFFWLLLCCSVRCAAVVALRKILVETERETQCVVFFVG